MKEFATASTKSSAGAQKDAATSGFEAWLKGSKSLFEDDLEAIKTLVLPNSGGSSTRLKLVGIDTLQKSIDILSERLDFTVQNSIPVPIPLSDQLRNSVIQRKDFIVNDYDKAVVDKILMVLVNSEGLTRKETKGAVAEEGDEDQDANLGKEQVSEEEVLKEQEEEEEEEEVVEEYPKKKKYSRDGENPDPWQVESLSLPFSDDHGKWKLKMDGKNVKSWQGYFYPASE